MESANDLPCIGWLPPITSLRGLRQPMKFATLMATSRTLMRAISLGGRAKITLMIANVMDEHRAGYVTQLQSEMDWRRVMLKSTPGPWRAEGEDVFCGHTCQSTHIANANPIKDMFRSTAEANARLIAAAPDLLEALQYLVSLGGGDALDVARAAIARALGEGERS